MRLLLDLGNTRLKWALQSSPSQQWTAHGAVEWVQDMAAALASAWSGLPHPGTVIAGSVVDEARGMQVGVCVERLFGTVLQWMRTPGAACGVRNAYAQPHRLGCDRFLAMIDAFAEGVTPAILAGVGTALTLDALAADGEHLGGLIAPGPQLMQQSLLSATARVRPAHEGGIVDAADNTADAVASGCWHASAALVERFAVRMGPRLGVAPTLLLRGGDAARLGPLLSLPFRFQPDAELRGLAVWADAQPPARPCD